jgi:hypothetical protein
MVNDIDWLKISPAGEADVTLRRIEGQWLVEEAANYRADWQKLHQLLSALAGAEIAEFKTSNPDYYSRLGVEDTNMPEAEGVLVVFHESTGQPPVIVGNAAQSRNGQYARLADSQQSVLLDRELDIPRTAEDWLDREIVDISDAEVVEINISHPDGDAIKALKVSADDENFELQGVPEGSEPKSNWTVNSLAGAFSSLELDAVAPESDIDWGESFRFGLLTVDGLNIEAELATVEGDGENDDGRWIRLEAGVFDTAVGSGVDENAGGAAAERADEINQRVSGWAYRIPEYKYTSMSKRMEDLVQETGPAE